MPKGIYERTKEHKAITSKAMTGRKLSKCHKKNISLSKTGNKHPRWQENPSYSTVHYWIAKIKGKPKLCEMCGLKKSPKGKKKWFQWANISGEYKRLVNDWIRLCYPCHRKYDNVREKIVLSWIKRKKL